MTNDRVALDKDWRIFAEPYLEGFQLTISRGHYDEEVILSADEAKALRDWLCVRYPVEPPAKPGAFKCPTCKRPMEEVQISELGDYFAPNRGAPT